jgi:hypothetical protein
MKILLMVFMLLYIPVYAYPQNMLHQKSEITDQAKDIISQSENFYKEYYFTSHIESVNNKGETEHSDYIGAIKVNSSLSLLISSAPPANKGKIFLQRGNDNYLYFPKAKRYMLVSSGSKMTGNVTYADISKLPTLSCYVPEKVIPGDEKKEIIEAHFTLKDDVKGQPYYKKVIFVSVNDKKITRVENYSMSGLLLSSCEYLEFRNIKGSNVPVKWKLEDKNKPGAYSILTISDIKETSLDQKIFNPGFLQHAENYVRREFGK